MELWPIFSLIAVAAMLFALITGRKIGAFTRRKAIIVVVAAPILFVASGLLLANTLVNPTESIQYQVGVALCCVVSPMLVLSGVFMYISQPRATMPVGQPPPNVNPGEKPPTPLPAWERRARKIYGVTALLLVGLLVFTFNPLMLLGLIVLIPYILLFVYMLMGRRSLVASLFFLLLWYVWFPIVGSTLSPLHFMQLFTELMRGAPYFGPLGYNVFWMFYSVVMFSGAVMLLLSSLSGIERLGRVMPRVFNGKMCAAVFAVPLLLMILIPPGLVTDPNMSKPSIVTQQALDIIIDEDNSERYYNGTSGEWVYSIAISYSGELLITNISLGGEVIDPPFDETEVKITEAANDAVSGMKRGVVLIRDEALVSWVSLVSENSAGEAIYSVGWY